MKLSTFLKWAVPAAASLFIPGVGGVVGKALTTTGKALLGTGGAAGGAKGGSTLASNLLGIGKIAVPAITSLYGSSVNRSVADQSAALQQSAIDQQTKAAADQLQFLKDQEAARQAEARRTEAANLSLFNRREANLTPYRNLGNSAGMTLGALLGLSPDALRRPYVPVSMPTGA